MPTAAAEPTTEQTNTELAVEAATLAVSTAEARLAAEREAAGKAQAAVRSCKDADVERAALAAFTSGARVARAETALEEARAQLARAKAADEAAQLEALAKEEPAQREVLATIDRTLALTLQHAFHAVGELWADREAVAGELDLIRSELNKKTGTEHRPVAAADPDADEAAAFSRCTRWTLGRNGRAIDVAESIHAHATFVSQRAKRQAEREAAAQLTAQDRERRELAAKLKGLHGPMAQAEAEEDRRRMLAGFYGTAQGTLSDQARAAAGIPFDGITNTEQPEE